MAGENGRNRRKFFFFLGQQQLLHFWFRTKVFPTPAPHPPLPPTPNSLSQRKNTPKKKNTKSELRLQRHPLGGLRQRPQRDKPSGGRIHGPQRHAPNHGVERVGGRTGSGGGGGGCSGPGARPSESHPSSSSSGGGSYRVRHPHGRVEAPRGLAEVRPHARDVARSRPPRAPGPRARVPAEGLGGPARGRAQGAVAPRRQGLP